MRLSQSLHWNVTKQCRDCPATARSGL